MNKAKYLNDVLTNMEAEDIVSRQLKDLTLDTYGSEDFIKQHVLLERLNMQAIKNALLGGDDFILENFVTYEKIKSLINELFVAYNFKNVIYPRIKNKICEIASCKVYICLYHEAVVINLLENFFFHVTACQASDDYIIDIIEYCYSKISRVVNNSHKSIKAEEKGENSASYEMDNKFEEIEFYIAMACISIIRYITDHLMQLSFPVRNHLMNVKDVPLLLAALMEARPWLKSNNGEVLIFENNQWKKQTSNSLPKLEAQVWIAIFNLFMNTDNGKKYEITEFRKNALLRLRKYMNESLYDQIPPLQQLFRALEEMSLIQYNAVSTSNPFVVEMIPMLFNKKFTEDEIKQLSEKIMSQYFPEGNSEMLRKEMEIISDVYTVGNLEYFMEDPKCATCGKDATSRCSKCKSEWYCGRDCQVKRWKQHKEMCGKLAEMNNQMNQADKERTSKESGVIKEVKASNKQTEEVATKAKVNIYDELD